MARINIEDRFWKDDGLAFLADKVGRHRAIGLIVSAWKLAQGFWVQEKLIPVDLWEAGEFPESMVTLKIVEIYPDGRVAEDGTRYAPGYYVRGSEEQFAWLVSQTRNGKKGGVASGKSRNASPPAPVPNGSKSLVEATRSHGEATAKPLEPSSLLSLKRDNLDTTHYQDCGSPRSATGKRSPLPRLALIWNEDRGDLSEVQGAGGERTKKAAARWNEHPDEIFWREVIRRIVASNFCRGVNDRAWKADFDFLIRPETAHKVLEGKYDNRAGQPTRQPPGARKRNLMNEVLNTPYSEFGAEKPTR